MTLDAGVKSGHPDTRVFISGSSADLFNREVHTSMRGRSMEVLVHPYELGWVRVGKGYEVDFYAEHPVAEPLLIQVSLDTGVGSTWEREIRSLEVATKEYRRRGASCSPSIPPSLETIARSG